MNIKRELLLWSQLATALVGIALLLVGISGGLYAALGGRIWLALPAFLFALLGSRALYYGLFGRGA